MLWQVEPAQGPRGTVARGTVAHEQIRLDWFGLLGKRYVRLIRLGYFLRGQVSHLYKKRIMYQL